MHYQTVNRVVRAGARIEANIGAPILVQAREIIPIGSRHRREDAADQNLSVTRAALVNVQRAHDAVGSAAHVEHGIQRAIDVEPREPVAQHAVDRREIPADDEAVVGLQRRDVNRAIRSAAAVGRVKRARRDVE